MAICSRERYREITGDITSEDSVVDAELAYAQQDLEERTDRLYESATRTESLLLDREGYVYPKALPVVSVSIPTQSAVDGNRVLIGSLVNISNSADTRVSVTYVGGYAEGAFPIGLVELVAAMAYQRLHRITDLPLGVTSVKVGDVAYSGKNLRDVNADYIKKGIRSWVHPARRLEKY